MQSCVIQIWVFTTCGLVFWDLSTCKLVLWVLTTCKFVFWVLSTYKSVFFFFWVEVIMQTSFLRAYTMQIRLLASFNMQIRLFFFFCQSLAYIQSGIGRCRSSARTIELFDGGRRTRTAAPVRRTRGEAMTQCSHSNVKWWRTPATTDILLRRKKTQK